MTSIFSSLWPTPKQSFADGKSRRIVIVGGGYAGIVAAQNLEKSLKGIPIEILIVERRDKFHHCVGATRALVQKGFEEYLWIPYDKFNTATITVRTNTHISSIAHRQMTTTTGETIPFDYCVIATGGTNAEPARFPTRETAKEAQEVSRRVYEAVRDAKSYVIVGGGAVGCEIAAEILTDYPGRPVTLIDAGPSLLAGATNNTSALLRSSIQAKLESLGCKVVLNEKLVLEKGDLSSPEWVNKGRRTIVTESGRKFDSDLQFMCIGNSSFNGQLLRQTFPKLVIEKTGEIKTKPTGQIDDPSVPWIFAIGDVSRNTRYKNIVSIRFLGGAATVNLAQLIRAELASGVSRDDADESRRQALAAIEKTLKKVRGGPQFSFVMLGRNGGRAEVPVLPVLGDWAMKRMKSRDGMTGQFWEELGHQRPKNLGKPKL